MALLDLPPIPPQLKSLSPFIQRADELKVQDPVVGYWCAYYAAQIGISHIGKDHATNVFLGDLLGVLENMKKDLASHDAIRDESVASAYVENFALKVFSAADNEDRAGRATRATAKRFLAAANFLEVLSVFSQPASDIILPGESTNAEKIKYAKWKAADIAKAYREGRKPTPGPANVVQELSPPLPEAALEPAISPTPSTPPSIPTATPGSPPSIVRNAPPPPQLSSLPSSDYDAPRTPPSTNHLLPGGPLLDPKSPGSWSTIATPGTPDRRFDDDDHLQGRSAFVTDEIDDDELTVASSGVGVGGISPPHSASSIDTTASEMKRVRFSPSTTGDSSVTTPSVAPGEDEEVPDVQVIINPPDGGASIAPPVVDPFPPGFIPTSIHPHPTEASPPRAPLFHPQPSAPPPHPTIPSIPPARSPQHYVPTIVPDLPQHGAHSTVTTTPVELTPLVVAKTQKHCRFAISALDYEDAETARKELRAALALLGG